MTHNPDIHHRRSIRLKGYDYSQAGAYFTTVCTQDRACLFGAVVDGEMRLNELGEIVREEWFKAANVRPYVVLYSDEFVIMPNHIHGIIRILDDVRATRRVAPTDGRVAPTDDTDDLPTPRGPASASVGGIIAQFKSIVTKRINERRGTPSATVWQRTY